MDAGIAEIDQTLLPNVKNLWLLAFAGRSSSIRRKLANVFDIIA